MIPLGLSCRASVSHGPKYKMNPNRVPRAFSFKIRQSEDEDIRHQNWEKMCRRNFLQNILRNLRQHTKSVVIKTRLTAIHNCTEASYDFVLPDRVTPLRQVPDYIQKPPYIITGKVETRGHPIEIKNEFQIDGMRKSCRLARKILDFTASHLQVGITTDELDKILHEECIRNKVYPSPLLYKDFPKSVCTSVNNVACHGIPDLRPLQDGDIVNIDVTIYHEGFHGDLSETYLVGDVDERGRRLVEVARKCRDAGVSVCRAGEKFNSIGKIISHTAARAGYNVIPNFIGHGIGSYFHGPPDIYHFDYEDPHDLVMQEGMTFTIEPIIVDGSDEIYILEDDGWTAVSADGSRSAQFEHTVLVTTDGVEILTAATKH